MTGQTHSDKFGDLRQQAEEALRRNPADSSNLDELSPEDVQRLLRELRVHQIELEMQNDELRRAQQELEASRDRYADLYDDSPVGYLTLSEQGVILEANLTLATLLGVARSDLIEQALTRFIAGEDQDIYYLHRQQLFETREPQVCELRMVRKDGVQFWARIEATVAQACTEHSQSDNEGLPTSRATVSDVSEQKWAEEQIKAALAEREVLLREVHHRVKNNMQSLIYLIDMQMEMIDDPAVTHLLEDFQGRVHAMGLVHEQLYQAKDLAHISFGSYLENLTYQLAHALAGDRPVALRVIAEDASINVHKSLPCAMIVNELVTNALKYAFPPPLPPPTGGEEIRVEFGAQENEYVLLVGDNGVGLPPDLDWQTSESLGLKLVNIWATYQLQGTLDVNTRDGTTFTIRFPK